MNKIKGPITLYRVSWSGGKEPNKEGSKYYADLIWLKNWVWKLNKDGAKIHVQTTQTNWKPMELD